MHIDPSLVERYLSELAGDGAYGETGVWRTVYSPEWVAAQDRYAGWCTDAGLQVRRDAVGNVWGVLPGRDPGGSIVTGSHIDSQCPGGRFDGALGVVAGLVAVRALHEQFGEPRRTLETLSLAEEESSRFPKANFWASRAIVGRIGPYEAAEIVGYDGVTMAEAMYAVDLDPARIPEAARNDIDTFIELHIEQGPILEQAGVPAGIVTGITGFRHYMAEVQGRADHAGAMPMALRRDPMQAAAEIISRLIANARELGAPAVTTIGRVTVEPNLPAIVPSKVEFFIDARHPDPVLRAQLHTMHEESMRDVAERGTVQFNWHVLEDQPPCPCDPALFDILCASAEAEQTSAISLSSGAAHDTQVMAGCSKVAMIFVRSKDGRSHTPEEFTSLEDAVAGIRVLAGALYRLAY